MFELFSIIKNTGFEFPEDKYLYVSVIIPLE
jgi:hypothetical protein